MPETRYVEVYEQGTGKLLRREEYVVSDEELEAERRARRLARILEELDELRARVERLERALLGPGVTG